MTRSVVCAAAVSSIGGVASSAGKFVQTTAGGPIALPRATLPSCEPTLVQVSSDYDLLPVGRFVPEDPCTDVGYIALIDLRARVPVGTLIHRWVLDVLCHLQVPVADIPLWTTIVAGDNARYVRQLIDTRDPPAASFTTECGNWRWSPLYLAARLGRLETLVVFAQALKAREAFPLDAPEDDIHAVSVPLAIIHWRHWPLLTDLQAPLPMLQWPGITDPRTKLEIAKWLWEHLCVHPPAGFEEECAYVYPLLEADAELNGGPTDTDDGTHPMRVSHIGSTVWNDSVDGYILAHSAR